MPRFYLAGFTKSGRKDGRLWILSLKDGRHWKGTPNSSGFERDYYALEEAPGVESDMLERAFSSIEQQLAPVLAQILKEEKLPPRQSREFGILLNHVAGLIIRVPRMLDTVAQFYASSLEIAHRLMLSTPERFRAALEQAQRAGAEIPAGDHEQLRQLMQKGRYSIEVPRPWLVGQMFLASDILLRLLAARHWSLLVVAQEALEFAVSDCPVVVDWTRARLQGFYPPALGLRKTDVTLPLSRRVTLLGRFETLPGRVLASRRTVAVVNTRTAAAGSRFVASPSKEFPVLGPDGKLGSVSDLVEFIQQRARRQASGESTSTT